MNGKLSCFIVLLVLIAGVEVRAQTATNIAGVYPNTNIVNSVHIGFAQGTCNDGTNYLFDTDNPGFNNEAQIIHIVMARPTFLRRQAN